MSIPNIGVSILAFVSSYEDFLRILDIYKNQNYAYKELIVACNIPGKDLESFHEAARKHPMVRVYRMKPLSQPEQGLEYCRNNAVLDITAVIDPKAEYDSEYIYRTFISGGK